MSSELLKSTLKELLDLAHHQVHFAEAKNAALLTLNFALIVGMVAVAGPAIPWQWAVYIFVVGGSLGLAALVSLLSFLPRLTPIEDRAVKDAGNVAFTGDIADMGTTFFLEALAKKLGIADTPTGFDIDVAGQVYVNSRIAASKFRKFKYAAYLTVAGLVVPSLWVLHQVATGALKMWV